MFLPISASPNLSIIFLSKCVSQNLDGVKYLQAGEMADLHATAFAVRKDDFWL
jgi:hypothetical protein